MNFLVFDKSRIEKYLTLKKLIEVYKKENFLATKKELLYDSYHEKEQIQIWKDYHALMLKAVEGSLNDKDLTKLYQYCDLEGSFEILALAQPDKLLFPVQVDAENPEKAQKAFYRGLDSEVTKQWFEHIKKIADGDITDVMVCDAEDCSNIFRKKRRHQRFCSQKCRKRIWRRENLAKKIDAFS